MNAGDLVSIGGHILRLLNAGTPTDPPVLPFDAQYLNLIRADRNVFTKSDGVTYQVIQAPFVYWGKTLTGPEQMVIPYAVPHASSPIVGSCS